MTAKKALPRLTRLVALMTPVRVPDGCGGFTEVWTELGKLWAEILPRSGREQGNLNAPLGVMSYRITVRAAEYGSPQRPVAGQVLVEGARRFEVLAVAERDAEGRFLICEAREEEVAT